MSIPALIALSLFVAILLLIVMLALFGGPSDGALRDYLREVADYFAMEIGPMGYLEGQISGHPMVIIPHSDQRMVISCPLSTSRETFALVHHTLPDDPAVPQVALSERGLNDLEGKYKLFARGDVAFLQPFSEHIAKGPYELIVGEDYTLTVYCDSHILAYTLEEIDAILGFVAALAQGGADVNATVSKKGNDDGQL